MAEREHALKVHHLRPAPGAKTAKTRVGRGEGGKGKTAGRGTKGTKARYQVSAAFEGGQMPLHMRLPKLRGFKNPFRVEYQVVNLDRISALFPEGGPVTVELLVDKGAVRAGHPVKVLGTGEAAAAFQVTVHAFSASAKVLPNTSAASIRSRMSVSSCEDLICNTSISFRTAEYSSFVLISKRRACFFLAFCVASSSSRSFARRSLSK